MIQIQRFRFQYKFFLGLSRRRSNWCNLSIERRFVSCSSSSCSRIQMDNEKEKLCNRQKLPLIIKRDYSSLKCDKNDTKDEEEEWLDKILWSSYLETIQHPKSNTAKRIREHNSRNLNHEDILAKSFSSLPISLKYSQDPEIINFLKLSENENHGLQSTTEDPNEILDKLQFPYQIVTNIKDESKQDQEDNNSLKSSVAKDQNDTQTTSISNTDANAEEDYDKMWFNDYGEADPSIPPSKISCGGCGALLHCQDSSIAGYMPAERFKMFVTNTELRHEICQRCYFLKEHNTALSVNISPNDYLNTLLPIREKPGLVLLMVDLLDFPSSIWPDIIKIIGNRRPLILIGNKVDILPRDSPGYLDHIRESLKIAAEDVGLNKAQILHIALVSATTGFGIEELISTIFSKWHNKGDVYIMGCTNVGKSSLFNAFLQSDFCTVHAVDLVQRATISQWPGTTLNLLKFPIMKIGGWKMHLRSQRLKNTITEEEILQNIQLKDKENKMPFYNTLIGHIGRTFMSEERLGSINEGSLKPDMFSINTSRRYERLPRKVEYWEPNNPKQSWNWCYDTPGAVGYNQIINLFTLQELMLLLPKSVLIPRTYYMQLGMTLFVAGIARLDYVEGEKPIRFTIFASKYIPITIVKTEDAQEVYEKAIGTEVFRIPIKSSEERLERFPALIGKDYIFEGIEHRESCGDIVFSSAGWASVTADGGQVVKVRVHTPGKKGIFHRFPSILPFAVNIRGRRFRDTPAYDEPTVPVPDDNEES